MIPAEAHVFGWLELSAVPAGVAATQVSSEPVRFASADITGTCAVSAGAGLPLPVQTRPRASASEGEPICLL